MTDKQKRLLELIRAFNEVCVELGIEYSLACGSALGAIREKGFIPWDEDLDIMMRINDYNKTEENVKAISTFKWVSKTTDRDSPVVFARIYENSVDFDKLEEYPYIDIHVYVGAPREKKKISRIINISDFFAKVYWVKRRKYHNVFRRKKSFIGVMCKIPLVLIPSRLCSNTLYEYTSKWPYRESETVMPLQGYYKMKEVLPKTWLDDYRTIEFSGINLRIIEAHDAYLTQLYGDYMTPVKYSN